MQFIRSIVLVLMCTSVVLGQKDEDDGPVGIFNSRSEYYQFMGSAKGLAYGDQGTPELRAMIPMLNDLALNQPIGSTAGQYNAGGTTMGLLADSAVRADIEMVDDQYDRLKEVSREIQSRSAERLRSMDFTDRDQVIEQVRSLQERAKSDLDAVLLPHQVTRLRQIQMQQQLRRKSLVQVLTSDPIKGDLEITESQSKELQIAADEINKELAKQIEALRVKARNKLLSTLEPEQEKEAKELFGDPFDFADSDNRAWSKNGARSKQKPNGKASGKKESGKGWGKKRP